MNRKQKIIISITSIAIVLLALLGLTYGYYLTRIQGNTNETSISITTADLKLEYAEGEDSNINITGLMPGQDIKTKTFTVTNSGNSRVDDYVVAIIDVINTLSRTEDLTYTLTCTEKMNNGTVLGPCNDINKISGTEFGPEYPVQPSAIVINSIEQGRIHEYSLKLNYVNLTNIDQSEDMGSIIKGKVQIFGLADTIDLTGTITGLSDGDYVEINSKPMTSEVVGGKYKLVGVEPGIHTLKIKNEKLGYEQYKTIKINKGNVATIATGNIELENESTVEGSIITMTEKSREVTLNITKDGESMDLNGTTITNYNPFAEGTLAYKILNDAYEVTKEEEKNNGYAIYRRNPLTKPAEETNKNDEASLSATYDDYGLSYYYRGNVKNNFVNFANKCWRIVRIDGNGNVKLILEDKYTTCEDGLVTDINNDGVTYTGDWSYDVTQVGYSNYDIGELTSSDGTKTNTRVVKIYDYLHGNAINETSLSTILKKFQIEELSEVENYLEVGNWCFPNKAYKIKKVLNSKYEYEEIIEEDLIDYYVDNTTVYYDSYIRLVGENIEEFLPILKCNGKIMNSWEDENDTPMYVGNISYDEAIFSGFSNSARISTLISYLNNNYFKNNHITIITLSISSSKVKDSDTYTSYYTAIGKNGDDTKNAVSRPSIVLKKSVLSNIGNGTQENPYVLSLG